MFLNQLVSQKKKTQKVHQQNHLNYVIHSILVLFECIAYSSLASLEEIKLIAIVN